MTLQQLRYFAEIARCHNFTRAAQRLAIAQPALSQSMAALEGEFDTKLFERHPRGVDLTDAGQRLFERCPQLLDAFDLLKQQVAGKSVSPAGRVRLCIAGSLASAVVAPLFLEMAQRYSDVELEVTDGLSSEVRREVETGRADLALMPSAVEAHGLVAVPVLEEAFVVVGSRSAPWPSASLEIAFETLAGWPLALPDRAHDLRKVVERTAVAAGVTLNVRFELNSPPMLVALAKAGLAYAVLPNTACLDALAAQTIMARPIVRPALRRTQALVWAQDRPPTVATAAVRDTLVQVIAALVKRGLVAGRTIEASHKAP
jgi:LysR family nitrogen assimilation transcriptional regulator